MSLQNNKSYIAHPVCNRKQLNTNFKRLYIHYVKGISKKARCKRSGLYEHGHNHPRYALLAIVSTLMENICFTFLFMRI